MKSMPSIDGRAMEGQEYLRLSSAMPSLGIAWAGPVRVAVWQCLFFPLFDFVRQCFSLILPLFYQKHDRGPPFPSTLSCMTRKHAERAKQPTTDHSLELAEGARCLAVRSNRIVI